jgi:hypothetical protein
MIKKNNENTLNWEIVEKILQLQGNLDSDFQIEMGLQENVGMSMWLTNVKILGEKPKKE